MEVLASRARGHPHSNGAHLLARYRKKIFLFPHLVIPKGGANGGVVSQGGLFGRWSLYVKDGKPKLAYNWLAREKYFIEGREALPEGKVTLVYDFTYDGGGLHKGGTGVLSINGTTNA
jgi:hypothetical protein